MQQLLQNASILLQYATVTTNYDVYYKTRRHSIRKMASNKQIDLRKIENFVRSKCYPADISKDKGKKANFRKSNIQRRAIFGSYRQLLIPQYHSILAVVQYSLTKFELQTK